MPSNKGGSSNGGIIGKSNKASFGKCSVTAVTATGNYTAPSNVAKVDVAVISGGGGGGQVGSPGPAAGTGRGGGGGGGGLLTFSNIPVNYCSATPVVIGAGGTSASGGSYPYPTGGSGENSIFGCSNSSVGGGGGGADGNTGGVPGGSGGGGAGGQPPMAAGSGTACQGNAGGTGENSAPPIDGSGGGGGGGGVGAYERVT